MKTTKADLLALLEARNRELRAKGLELENLRHRLSVASVNGLIGVTPGLWPEPSVLRFHLRDRDQHQATLHAWVDGKAVQHQPIEKFQDGHHDWVDYLEGSPIHVCDGAYAWRVKPDLEVRRIQVRLRYEEAEACNDVVMDNLFPDNLELTFDDGELVGARVIANL